MKSLKEFLKSASIKLASNSKAKKLIDSDAAEEKIAIAMLSTKAYKENDELKEICDGIIATAKKKEKESTAKEDKRSSTSRYGEPER